MPDQTYLDANVILRVLLDDVPVQTRAIVELLRESQRRVERLLLNSVTLAEVVHVLEGRVYNLPREHVAASVERILELPITVEDADIAWRALDLYREEHPDWGDCYLAACAMLRANGRVATFDRQLQRLRGLDPMPLQPS